MIFNGLFTDDQIDVKHNVGVDNYKGAFHLYDQLREFNDILHYSYWNSIDRTKLYVCGWYEFSLLRIPHRQITIYPHAIGVGGTKETPYLTLENTAHTLDLLRKYT